MSTELFRGQVDLLLLSVLARAPSHGYGLVESLREQSDGAFEFAEGTVYPALYRLEHKGHVTSRWELVGKRRRRVYRLTRRGRGALERERADWRAFASAVEAVVA